MPTGISIGPFYGLDSVIDLSIFLVALWIAYESGKIYKSFGNKKHLYFSWAFIFISTSQLLKIAANFTGLPTVILENNNISVTIMNLASFQIVYLLSFTLYKILLVLGFLTLFLTVTKTDSKQNILLVVYLSIVTVLFSVYLNFVFNFTLAVILLILCAYFYSNYKKTESLNSLLVYLSFTLVFLSKVLGVLYPFSPIFYLIDEGLLLAGFIILLVNQLNMIKKCRKEEQRSK